ncbi:MAG TPA: DUF488 domain-containing protein [Alphaproteobacteria bacterium]|jgi:uncharacterized protein YeaO (DUF488 family)|nr:DUF488 domain-containing protein [Alphaproteobacteria bacterium]
MIRIKRIYEPAAKGDGTRVLVDRIWPRGLAKEKAALDLWLKAIAPSTDLRKWFGHDPARWDEFRERYGRELDGNEEAVGQLESMIANGPVTLLYSAHDAEHNQAVALADYLKHSQS